MFIKYLKILLTSSNNSYAVNYSNGCSLLIFIFFSFNISNAQLNEFDFKRVFIEVDGEVVYDVHTMVQDHQGYMWMSTNLGLIRYNGIEGKKYINKVNDASYIEALFVDSQGDIWIGSTSGLSKYNPDCDCINEYPLTDVLTIAEDKNQDLWFGTSNGELYKHSKENNSFTKFLNAPSEPINLTGKYINKLIVDRNNNLWIATEAPQSEISLGLIRFNIDSVDIKQFLHEPTNPNSLLNNDISALYEDQQGQILIGTLKSGFHIYNPQSRILKRISFNADTPNKIHAPYSDTSFLGGDPFVWIIHQDKNGGYWISTSGKGINYFNTSTKTFKNYNFNPVNPQMTSSIHEDRQGNIWVGGIFGSGLVKADPFARQYNVNTNFRSVTAAYESALNPGILWINSRAGGLSKMDIKTEKTTKYSHDKNNSKSIGHNWVRSVYQENETTLWVGIGNGAAEGFGNGDGGIDRMDIESGTFTHFKLTRKDDTQENFSFTAFTICEDAEGYLWLGAGVGGLFRSDKEKKTFKPFILEQNDDNQEDTIVTNVRIDSNGNLWAVDQSNGGILYLFNRDENTFTPYLKGFSVTNIVIDEQGWYVMSTWKKGLIHLNPKDGTFMQYTKEEGLPSNFAIDIVKGNNNVIWIGTGMGPAQFDSKTRKISSIGLPKGLYSFRIFKSIDNQIFLGSNYGLASFYADKVIGNPYPPQIHISELLISENNYLTGKNNDNTLKFAHNQNDISFKYNALHFSDSEKNLYQYRLKPINNEWTKARFERSARYFNLPPDDYTFEVKASNSDGLWSEIPENISFTIKPAWWTTWWAYLIFISALVFLADRFYRLQLSKKMADLKSKRLKEVDQFKNKLFTNITHEFRTPLTVIKGMTDTIKSNLKTKKLDEVENSLEMIERNSDSLLHLVNEMLDLSKIESGTMELQLVQSDVIPFLKYLGESFSSFAEENQINFTVYSEIDTLVMDFDSKKLASVFSNLLSNAIKFTPEYGKIIVHINEITQKDDSYLSVKIKDNGIGISSEDLPNIFNRFYQTDASTIRKHEGTGIGLSLTKELVALMHGTIEANSTLNKGSEFSVMIPITREATATAKVEFDTVAITPNYTIASKPIEKSVETNSVLPLVLIIEDNLDVAHYLKSCLANTYKTIHAVNGNEGIEIALEKIPDIIICDVMMPGKDGFEVCATLKSDERSDHIPIIILTAKVTTEDRLTGLSHGADVYLAKPFNKEELYIRLDQLVTLRKKLINKIQDDGFTTLLKKRTKDPKLQFLKKVIKLIHKDIGNSNFGSEDLAEKLHISESQLYRKTKAITEKSTAVFIRSIRLQHAKELLSTQDKSVSEIAYEVGFNDPSWFSRAFKDEFGFSPSEIPK